MKESPSKTVPAVLSDFAARLSTSNQMRVGTIALRMSGKGGGDFTIDCAPGRTSVKKSASMKPHLIEIIGKASDIKQILAGKKDARRQFMAGGFRIRGDIRYLSDLAMELGILKDPI